jgi:hypothetical protein
VSVTIHESTADTFALALPPALNSDELDEAQLATATGAMFAEWFVIARLVTPTQGSSAHSG